MKIKSFLKLSLISATLITSYEAQALFGFGSKKTTTASKPTNQTTQNDVTRKNADKLFPGMFAVGCAASVAAPFDPVALSKYMAFELNVVLNEKDPKKKQEAMKGIKRVQDYVKRLDTCSLNAADKNFNAEMTKKFPQTGGAFCAAPGAILNGPKGRFGQMDINQIYMTFLDSVYNIKDKQSLCSKVLATQTQVGNNAKVEALKKELGIPSGLEATAKYSLFPASLTEPLTFNGVSKKLMDLGKLDAKVFTDHFSKILQKIQIKGDKTIEPKAVENLVLACRGEMGKVGHPLIKQVCTQAIQTGGQNQNNKQLAEFRKDLGIPTGVTAFAHYKAFDTSLVKGWVLPGAGEKMIGLFQLSSKDTMNHLKMILKGVQGNGREALNPNSTKFVVEACQTQMGPQVQSKLPIMKEICAAALRTNTTNNKVQEVEMLKNELGVSGTSMLMFKTSCSPSVLSKLNVNTARKWSAADPKGFSEYVNTISKCFKGKDVKNPKLAQFIDSKCSEGLATVKGAETLCRSADKKVMQINDQASQELLAGMEGMVQKDSPNTTDNPFSSDEQGMFDMGNQNMFDEQQGPNMNGVSDTDPFGNEWGNDNYSDDQGMFDDGNNWDTSSSPDTEAWDAETLAHDNSGVWDMDDSMQDPNKNFDGEWGGDSYPDDQGMFNMGDQNMFQENW